MGSAISNGVYEETSAMDGPRAADDHHVEELNNGETYKPSTKLEIGIVGAGLAGLGAAIALRRKGYSVEVGRGRLQISTQKRETDEPCF